MDGQWEQGHDPRQSMQQAYVPMGHVPTHQHQRTVPLASSSGQRKPPQQQKLPQIHKCVVAEVYDPPSMRGLKSVFGRNFEPEIGIRIVPKDGSPFNFDIIALQRFGLFHLQSRIVAAAQDLRSTLDDTESSNVANYLTTRLHEYCEAVRDLEYMEEWVQEKHGVNNDNLFQMRSSRQLERKILDYEGFITANQWPSAADKTHPLLPGVQLGKKKDPKHIPRMERFTWASIAAGLIIGPVAVILKVSWNGINLLAPCIAIVILILLLVFVDGFQTRDAFTLTAAYASVLSVFVGTKTRI